MVKRSILNLSKKIQEIIGFEGDLIFDTNKPDGNPRKFLDSTVINNLGWKSEVNLDTGLELTYKWFLKNI